MPTTPEPKFATLAVHAGAAPDPTTGARATPIYQTTSFVFQDTDHAASLFALQAFGNIYTRITNPTQAVLEGRIAALEGGTAALAVASGHAAQFLTFHTLLEPGDEFIAGRQLYGGSINQFNHSFKKFDWRVVWADALDPASFEKAVTPKTRAIFCESIANPGGVVVDLPAIAKVAKAAGVPLIVDNTLATPYLCRPKDFGADIVVHSLTKFIGGHGNSIGGALVDCGTFDWMNGRHRYKTLVEPNASYNGMVLGEDLRQHGLRHRRARHGIARHRTGDLAVQRLHAVDRRRDAAAAYAAPFRQCACRCQIPREAPEGRLGELCRPARQRLHALHRKICPKGAGAVFTFGSRAAMTPA